jgi:tRNA wybutosine-synthesizing protein 4
VRAGYFADDFVSLFVRKPSRRSPLIHRGYYSRHAALEALLHRFLAAAGGPDAPKQVLALGAGFDTSFFRLAAAGAAPGLRYFEVDFPEVTTRKAAVIAARPELRAALAAGGGPGDVAVDAPGGRITAPRYALLPGDLRDTDALLAALGAAGFDPSLPTYVLSECVLVYMDPAPAAALLARLASVLRTAVVVVYEQIRPDDAFGRQMVTNLEARGCPLRGLRSTPSLEAHAERLRAAGWAQAEALDMDAIYRGHLDPADKARIERLELFDEFEEWHMIQAHYAIAVGRNDPGGELSSVTFGSADEPPQ